MRIHASQMNISSASLYSAAAAEKAAAAHRAAEVRKKLAESASDIESASDPDQAFLIGHWLGPQPNPAQDETQYHPSGKVPGFG
ncbi:MAG: hypothetical protein ABR956_01250 [Terracidiphilus sp.]